MLQVGIPQQRAHQRKDCESTHRCNMLRLRHTVQRPQSRLIMERHCPHRPYSALKPDTQADISATGSRKRAKAIRSHFNRRPGEAKAKIDANGRIRLHTSQSLSQTYPTHPLTPAPSFHTPGLGPSPSFIRKLINICAFHCIYNSSIINNFRQCLKLLRG